ncbi:hypothetical protein H7J73_23660 [Mycolicibacterium komossense]|uniref:Mce protein n=1 Tax=Mycolicibacterium komossense TaxID=1779 RepID=A0ABT3CI37_9MYCO|nr:hypothetical protein [Mycolicibacterium komossense]
MLAAAEEAEAEAAAAEAESRAAAARARAIKLRREAAVAPPAEQRVEEPPTDPPVDPLLDTQPVEPPRRHGGGAAKVLAASVAVLLTCAGAGASGYLLWHHHTVVQREARTAEFSAAARQGVVNLMTVDSAHAKEDVQRLLDSSTGKFKDDLQSSADDLTDTLEQSKVAIKVTVQSSAVESMNADSGVVLVAARSEAAGDAKEARPPADWRLAVTLNRDGGQLKMSAVDFVSN